MNYVCNVQIDGIPCGVTVPADEVGAALMQQHLLDAHDVPSKLPYHPTPEDRQWARRSTRTEEMW